MEPTASTPPDSPDVHPREGRQRAEILRHIEQGRLHHAIDLAHEHLREFPDDHLLRDHVVAAVQADGDERVRRRTQELDPRR